MVPIQWVWWAPHTMSRVTWLVPGVPGVPCAPTLVPVAGATAETMGKPEMTPFMVKAAEHPMGKRAGSMLVMVAARPRLAVMRRLPTAAVAAPGAVGFSLAPPTAVSGTVGTMRAFTAPAPPPMAAGAAGATPGAGAGTGRTLPPPPAGAATAPPPPPPAGAATAPPPPAAGAGRVGRKPAALAAPAVIRAAPVMLTITQVFTLFGRREDIWHLSRVVARRVHAAGRR